MDIKFNYNDTISTVNSKKPEVVDLETKDPVLLKSNKSADTVLPISPNDTTINTDDVITSSDKRYTVEVTNPEDPHVIGHTRNFYRGRSFRFAGIWTKGVHYICDEYVVDFVVKDNTLLACSKSHMSTSENEPVDFVYKDNHMVGVVSEYWDFVLTGAAGKTGGVYLPSYDEENDQLVWTLITEDLDDTVYTPLGLKVQIDKALAPIVSDVDTLKGDINSLNLVTTRISSDVTGLEQRVENAEGNIGQLRLDADAFDVRMSDAEGNIGQLALTAREFSVEMSNVQGDVGRLWLTAQEFGVRMSNAEGDVSLLKQTADEIQTRVENAEGDISQIHQRADEISSQVENAQGDISRIEQKANSIESTVQDAQGDISQLKQTATEISTRVENNEGDISRISQRADEIESTVENAQGDISQLRQTATEISSTVATNKELADGAIAENKSLISQTAEEIRSEVESNVNRLDGEIEQNRSEIRQTAEEITSTVERNKQETDGAIESAKSEFKQTADEISATVERNKADADGQIETTRSEIRQTADSITSTVEANKRAVDGSILELNSTITQTAEEIRAEVARVETDVNGNIEDAKSEMKQTADEISATVARNKAESDGSFQSVSSQLSIQADQIQSTVDSIESVEDRVTTSESNITQLSNEISTKVSQTDFNTKTQQIESSISTIDQKADGIRASVTTLSGTVDNNARAFSDYATATDAELVEMQRQLDGAIESWFYEGVPTLNNVPTSNWTTVEDKNVHLGDLYYDKLTGYAYRFMHDETNGYYWTRIEDSDITLALENAAKAQDTADNKRRVFLTQPKPPYDAGDLWVQGHTANNDGVIFRCVNSRESGTFISSDWELASDSVTTKIARSNFEVLSNAIVGTVSSYTYDSNGVLDSATQSRISQTADAIRLSVSNGAIGTALGTNGAINSALLDTGIDITNGDITLTANHIKLQNQNAVSGLELVTTGSGSSQRVVIDVSSLNVSGIFTTQAWSGTNGVRAGIISDANTYANTVAGNAQTNAINDTRSYVNSTDYLNNSVVPLITNATSGLAKDSDYNYLKAALLDGTTTVAGGLVLSSLIKLGYNAGTDEIPDWQIMSGINGVAVPTEPGKGIAAWYGGDMEDGEKSGASANAAKSLFRMDGSGYLAGGQISWGNTGSIVIHGATLQGTNGNITTGELVERILEIGSWFVKDSYVDGNGVTRYYLRLVCGDTTNLAGFASDGFVSGSGLSPGGGSGGIDPEAMWQLLGDSTNEQIAASHLTTALNGYATQDWVMGRGYITGINSSMITTALGYTPVAPSALADYVTLATSQIITGDKIFDSANLSVPAGSLYISNYGNDTIDQWINFYDASGKNAQIGIRRAIDTYGPTYHYKYGSIEYYYKFWHEGNFTPSDYLTTVSAASTYAKLRTYNDLTFASDEFTFAQAAHSGALWFNARTASGLFDGAITYYRMGNGAASYAGVMASGYYLASNADNSYVLTAGGDSAAISGLTVATATNCVLKSGDTMTGALTINTTSYGNQLIIKRNESNHDAMIRFENAEDGLLGYIGIRGSGSNKVPSYSSDTLSDYVLLHSGNFSSYALPITGGVMQGSIGLTGYTLYYREGGTDWSVYNFSSSEQVLGIPFSTTYIRSGNTNLYHYKGSASYVILDESNYDSYALPLSGGKTVTGTFYMSLGTGIEVNGAGLIFTDSNGNSFVGRYNSTTYIRSIDTANLYHRKVSGGVETDYPIFDTSNYTSWAVSLTTSQTISAMKVFSTPNWGEQIEIHRAQNNYDAMIKFSNDSDGAIGWFGVRGSDTPASEKLSYSPDRSANYAVYHAGNSNKSDVAWECSTLTASSSVTASGGFVTSGSSFLTVYSPGYGTYNRISFSVFGTDHVELEFPKATDDGAAANLPVYFGWRGGYYPLQLLSSGAVSINAGNSTGAVIGTITFKGGNEIACFSGDRKIWLNYDSTGDISMCNGGGSVGIGKMSPSYKLDVSGDIVASGAITAGSASDARLKTNIQTMTAAAALRLVMALRPVTFDWNSTATKLYDQYKGNDLGFIAQEVEPYLPQAIGTIFEKYMRLDQTKVIAPLVKVAQDHETRIRQLERENAELKRRLNMN